MEAALASTFPETLRLVPGLQATVASFSDTSGVIVRPRIGLRWTF